MVVLVEGLDLEVALGHVVADVCEVLVGEGEGDIDGLDLGDVDEGAGGVVGRDEVALVDEEAAGFPVYRGDDRGVAQLELGVLDGGLGDADGFLGGVGAGVVGLDGGVGGLGVGAGLVEVFLGHVALFREGGVAFELDPGVLGLGLVACRHGACLYDEGLGLGKVGLGLLEGDQERGAGRW